jgi:predicted ATPase
MRLKKIHIRNFKSLVDFQLKDLKPFCAFVGPNASGKSNIFEALEFSNYAFKYSFDASAFFGGKKNIYSYNPISVPDLQFPNGGQTFYYEFFDGVIIDFYLRFSDVEDSDSHFEIGSFGSKIQYIEGIKQLTAQQIRDSDKRNQFINSLVNKDIKYENDFEQFADRFSRIFIGNDDLVRLYGSPHLFSSNLTSDASNLSQILGKIFEDEIKRSDFIEWLSILIPEFERIEVKKSNLSGDYDYFIYEKSSDKPFPHYLISDGTKNILALMAAVYQSSQPQFLCIEEPENGLHPQAIQSLIDFFREKAEKEGHYIWINTHSQTLVRCLQIDEIILVNKINGRTNAKQLTADDKIDIKTDEAWLTNALGGGTLWST